MHEDIQIVRVPRQAKKKLSFAFFEFGSEAKCEEAKVIFFQILQLIRQCILYF